MTAAQSNTVFRGRLTILYGSQTGCSEEVAHRLSSEAVRRRYEPACLSMEDYDVRQLPTERMVILVASTTGEGEVPDGMRAFWQFLLRRDLPPNSLGDCTHACFGLGDSSYPKFNFAAKRLHRRLTQLGSTPLVPIGLGDDQDGLGIDHALAPWLVEFWAALDGRMPLPAGTLVIPETERPAPRYEVVQTAVVAAAAAKAHDITDAASTQPEAALAAAAVSAAAAASKHHPHHARVLANTLLTKPGIGREVRHIELDVSGWGLRYAAGDALAVQPLNPEQPTLELLAALGFDPHAPIRIRRVQPHAPDLPQREEWTALTLFREHLDVFGVPRRPFFALLAHFATLPLHAETLAAFGTPAGAMELLDYCTRCRRTYAEVLLDFASARPPLEFYLDLIPPLRARYFSIASSPELHPTHVHLTVSVVRYATRLQAPRFGVCSTYLAGLTPAAADAAGPAVADTVRVWLRKGCLRLPVSASAAIIMVGPGTGVAPFRAFVQTREAQRRKAHHAAGVEAAGAVANAAGEGADAAASQDARGTLAPSSDGEAIGDSVLFFGCRRADHDFLYASEWEAHVASGALRGFDVAFSRAPGQPKVYVQHKMREHANGARLWRLLALPTTHVYIAGAANQMPKDVRQALREVAMTHGALDEEAAAQLVKTLEAEKRMQCETW